MLETLRLVGEGKLQSSLVGKLRAEKLLSAQVQVGEERHVEEAVLLKSWGNW